MERYQHNYRECLRNHAATLGSYATDGCGEFTLDDSSPTSLNCAACGCHRNFHRKPSYTRSSDVTTTMEIMQYTEGGSRRVQAEVGSPERSGKKRFRTKFSSEQKEKMLGFAEKKDEEDEVEKFCRGVGVSRQVFKVWMHNHKNSSSSSSASTGNASSLTSDQ
ncbi:hypothetical protein Patl1_19520 [Pistacia atlantica]|uniref:Uncharacterized protein n=1 Tax=Pistacia atlantica TaxID=434234 RepID=A0ACC1BX45_9ROSI|nr:hypothetical protein Patl1_19520 [Pistacia atlantica]